MIMDYGERVCGRAEAGFDGFGNEFGGTEREFVDETESDARQKRRFGCDGYDYGNVADRRKDLSRSEPRAKR